jgi:predicted metal-dependent phosphoesterase TrpH
MSTIRAAVHVHSDWSYDGHLTLAEVARLFARKRYGAVFMCEHDRGFSEERLGEYRRACQEASAHGALLIPGIEYGSPDDRVHVAVWGQLPFLGEQQPTTELLERVAGHGGVAVLAHPVRRDAAQIVERRWLELCTGLEIWTRKWDGWAPNVDAVQWSRDHNLLPVVSLDLHLSRQTFPLAMALELSDDPDSETCVNALKERRARPVIGPVPATLLCEGAPATLIAGVERVRRPLAREARRLLALRSARAAAGR